MSERKVPMVSQCQPALPVSAAPALKRPPSPAEQLAAYKRVRTSAWCQETPPPSPQDSSSDGSGEDTSDEEETPPPPAAGSFQGSILASCLLADRREPSAAVYNPNCEFGRAGPAFSWCQQEPRPPPPSHNQTVECDGKSYIQLGALPARRERSQFYRYQRFTVLHATMVKLSRHRRMTDPRLRKSVLLFNTMRHIERELEQEGLSLAAAFNPHHFDSGSLTLDPPPPPQTPPPPPPPPPGPPAATAAAPGPAAGSASGGSPGNDSGFGEDDEINWGSVLSLSSQSELELAALLPVEPPLSEQTWHLTPLSADDVLRTFPVERRDDDSAPSGEFANLLAL